MLGGNLGSLLYGDVSVMLQIYTSSGLNYRVTILKGFEEKDFRDFHQSADKLYL